MEGGGKDSPINPLSMQPSCGWESLPSLLDLTTQSLPGVQPPPSSPCLLPWDATGGSRPSGKVGRGTWVGLVPGHIPTQGDLELGGPAPMPAAIGGLRLGQHVCLTNEPH